MAIPGQKWPACSNLLGIISMNYQYIMALSGIRISHTLRHLRFFVTWYTQVQTLSMSLQPFSKKNLKKKEQMETTTFKQFMVARRVPHSGIGQYAHIVYHTVHEFGTVFYMGYPG